MNYTYGEGNGRLKVPENVRNKSAEIAESAEKSADYDWGDSVGQTGTGQKYLYRV